MTTTISKCLQFKRTTWQPGATSSLLADLVRELNARHASVRFTRTLPDGTTRTTVGGPDEVYDLTELPTGHRITVQYVRGADGGQDISNFDVLSLDPDVVWLVVDATATQYKINILTKDAALTDSTFALLNDRLTVHEIMRP